MIRILRWRPARIAVLVGATVAALALAGCAAGQVTSTAVQQDNAGGATAGAGTISVHDARIAFVGGVAGGSVHPRGASAPLQMRIVNIGTLADRLMSASSPVATSVEIAGDTEVPGGQTLLVEGVPPAETGRRDGATPTPTAAAGPQRTAQVVLTDLREDVRAGLTYQVVLVFERAGEIRIDVPLGEAQEPREPAA